MKIIAENQNGFIIEASKDEIKSILSCFQSEPKPKVGDVIPSADYSGSIQKAKTFKDSYDYRNFKEKINTFNKNASEIISSIESIEFIQ